MSMVRFTINDLKHNVVACSVWWDGDAFMWLMGVSDDLV